MKARGCNLQWVFTLIYLKKEKKTDVETYYFEGEKEVILPINRISQKRWGREGQKGKRNAADLILLLEHWTFLKFNE